MTLTVRDEWQVSATSARADRDDRRADEQRRPGTDVHASCQGLTCSVNSTGTADPNTGDTIAYSWNWGDGTALSTGASPSAHTYAAAGAYTITLTTTDGWGKFASTTRNVNLVEPAGNTAPSVAVHRQLRVVHDLPVQQRGTVDPQGDVIRYAWTFGDARHQHVGQPVAHLRGAGHLHGHADGHRRVGQVRHGHPDVTITEPAGNNGPTATFVAPPAPC